MEKIANLRRTTGRQTGKSSKRNGEKKEKGDWETDKVSDKVGKDWKTKKKDDRKHKRTLNKER